MTPAAARALVRKHGALVFTDTEGAPGSFVHAVTGERVRGSWWGHARGHEIWNLAQSLGADVVSVKLVAGKETLVHRDLWPALARVATDEGFRRPRLARLRERARALLEAAQARPPLRLDEHAAALGLAKPERRALDEARRELERSLLLRTDEVHTETGRHASVLEPWEPWIAREGLGPAVAALAVEDALARLRAACGSAPTGLDDPAPPRRPRRARG